MAMSKEQILNLARPLLVKWVTRGVLWLLTAKLGLDAAAAESDAGQIGLGIAAAACMGLSYLIDRYNHKRDLAEVPK